MAQDWPIQRVGARGGNVRTVQHLLRHHGRRLTIDDIFGPQTREAVRHFQRDRALRVDGIVGNQTWRALIVVLASGSRGHAVRAVQRQLNARDSSVAVDGIFGEQTARAVREFQEANALLIDGIVGRRTWFALVTAPKVSPANPALDGCTVGQTTPAVTLAVGTVGDLLDPIPLVNWSIQGLWVQPKRVTIQPPPPISTLSRSVSAMQNWFFAQTGSRLRIKPEIRDVVLDETNDQIAAHGDFVRDRIEFLLRQRGFDHPFTLYAVWYDGFSSFRCGGGAWPTGVETGENRQTPGHVAALYLRAAYVLPDGRRVECATDQFTADGQTPARNEFKMLHEILHTMGIVHPDAPHHTARGHTSDNPQDLMYGGDRAWDPTFIDPGNDDYFRTQRRDIIDLSRSVFLDPSPRDAEPPPGW